MTASQIEAQAAFRDHLNSLALHPRTRSALAEAAYAIHIELWAFEWSRGDGQPLGDVSIDGDLPTPRLHLRVVVEDNDNPGDVMTSHLRVDILPLKRDGARSQIRALIHLHLCHEADEQLRFDGERPFYPYDQHPRRAS